MPAETRVEHASPRHQPTLDEVARLAGVSRATVSRVVNNSPRVTAANREATERAIRELGYVPNQSARALASSSTGAVILAAADPSLDLFADPFFSEVILGVSSVLEKTELELSLVLASSPEGRARLQRTLASPRADGIMLVALRTGDPLHRVAQDTHLPLVLLGSPPGAPGGDAEWYVDADNYTGARLAAEHLIGSGRRRIALIAGPADVPASAVRQKGFSDALTLAGLAPDLVVHADFTVTGGDDAMRELLARDPAIDGVFAASDNMAAGALAALKAAGRSVPADVAVVGFDDMPIATYTHPALTTVSQPVRAMGRELARMLLSAMGKNEPHPVILPTRLVVRESAP